MLSIWNCCFHVNYYSIYFAWDKISQIRELIYLSSFWYFKMLTEPIYFIVEATKIKFFSKTK